MNKNGLLIPIFFALIRNYYIHIPKKKTIIYNIKFNILLVTRNLYIVFLLNTILHCFWIVEKKSWLYETWFLNTIFMEFIFENWIEFNISQIKLLEVPTLLKKVFGRVLRWFQRTAEHRIQGDIHRMNLLVLIRTT